MILLLLNFEREWEKEKFFEEERGGKLVDMEMRLV